MEVIKKNKVRFVSTEFSACLLDCPFGYGFVVSEGGLRQCQVLSTSSPQQPMQS